MLDIRLYGEFRLFAEEQSPHGHSKLEMDYISGENVSELLTRIGINPNKTGELLVNFAVAELHTIIPRDKSRVAIFPEGMVLLCGASHLKGHSYTKMKASTGSYYGKPEVK